MTASQNQKRPRPVQEPEFYLGDGLYVRIEDGYVIIRAPREDGDHWVGMDAVVLDNFLAWMCNIRKQLMNPV